jgi:two-component system, NtrC family, sensor histidine kinase HydH
MRGILVKRPPRSVIAVYLGIAAISIAHYVSPVHAHQLHDIYRRLYYLPIIFAAFSGGFYGAVIAATIVCGAYLPHAFGRISHDPASDTQKILEMVLYFAVAITTGSLVSRLKGTQARLEGAARDLGHSLDQLKSTEEQLVRSARLAAVGQLSAGLAHEIRNPLAAIKGSAELLADDFPPGHPKQRLLHVLIEESVRLNNVLSRFLAFAKPRPIEEHEFNIVEEIASVISLLQSRRTPPFVRFAFRPPPTPILLLADRERLRQVLLNIFLNACEATPTDGAVRIDCAEQSGFCAITVRDEGSGFSREAIDNAFTPFFTTKEHGTGLGLAVSHRIVELHGGTIRLTNAAGGGGIVELLVPLGARHNGLETETRTDG